MKCWFLYQDRASSCVGHVAWSGLILPAQPGHRALTPSWAGDMVRECCVLSVNVYICQIIMMEKNRFGVG